MTPLYTTDVICRRLTNYSRDIVRCGSLFLFYMITVQTDSGISVFYPASCHDSRVDPLICLQNANKYKKRILLSGNSVFWIKKPDFKFGLHFSGISVRLEPHIPSQSAKNPKNVYPGGDYKPFLAITIYGKGRAGHHSIFRKN